MASPNNFCLTEKSKKKAQRFETPTCFAKEKFGNNFKDFVEKF